MRAMSLTPSALGLILAGSMRASESMDVPLQEAKKVISNSKNSKSSKDRFIMPEV
jgi:hypothetical protein